MRSDSPESVEDTSDDEGSKGGDEKSTKSESVGYAKVRKHLLYASISGFSHG